MIYQASGIYYIPTKNYIIKYRTNVDKLTIYKELPGPDRSFFEKAENISIAKEYKHEIVKQIFGGGMHDWIL